MEDILEVYQRKFTEDEVLVCMDETSKQHTKETRIPLPMRPGEPEIFDFEYERNGVSNLFMLFAPLAGWRHVKVTDRHTKIDWAYLIKELVDEHFPGKKIILVMDNLNTHKLGSLYEAFEPEEAEIAFFGQHISPPWRLVRNLWRSQVFLTTFQSASKPPFRPVLNFPVFLQESILR